MARWDNVGQFGNAVLDEMQDWQDTPLFEDGVAESYKNLHNLDQTYYVWLACAVRLLRPEHILELGTLRGFSTMAMYSELMPWATLTTVDIEPSNRHFTPRVEADPRVRAVTGDDLDLSIFGGQLPEDVEFLFIDTEHTFEHVSAEWNLYRQFLVPGALVAVDDVGMHDMVRWWNTLPYETAIEFSEAHSTGFGYFFYREARA